MHQGCGSYEGSDITVVGLAVKGSFVELKVFNCWGEDNLSVVSPPLGVIFSVKGECPIFILDFLGSFLVLSMGNWAKS